LVRWGLTFFLGTLKTHQRRQTFVQRHSHSAALQELQSDGHRDDARATRHAGPSQEREKHQGAKDSEREFDDKGSQEEL
jgi:hypothetical protein